MEPALPTPETPSFGSLAQSARTKTLKQARGILIVVGVLSIFANLIFMMNAPAAVDQLFKTEVEKLQRQGMIVDETKLADARDVSIRRNRSHVG
jgi:hypothetical protein